MSLDPDASGASGKPSALSRARAFSVHLFTAGGAALALLALHAAVRGEWVAMFSWLAVALFVDAIDGTLARRLRVADIVPRWSGDALDLVVDFLTYVFVPAYAMAASGLLPASAALPLAIAIVVASAIYFADREMKTMDNFFRGFPALWNAAAFYLFLLQPPPWIATVVLALFVALMFAPIRFVHPFRVEQLRPITVFVLVLWCALGIYALARNFSPGPLVQAGLCLTAAYFFAVGTL